SYSPFPYTTLFRSFSSNFSRSNFNTTSITNNATVTNTLVLTTSTRPVLSWSEDSFIEQTIFFWFQSTIVDSFWFFNFTIRPTSDLVWRSQTDLHTFKLIYVDQKFNLLYYLETLSSDEVEESLSSTGSSGLSSFFAASSANFFFSCC